MLFRSAPILRHEPFGMVGPEAQAHGKAVIAFGGGGVDEWLVDGHTGIRVPERTATSLRNVVRGQLENPDRSRELGRLAGRHFDHFRPDAYLKRLIQSFEKSVSGTIRLNLPPPWASSGNDGEATDAAGRTDAAQAGSG